MPALKTLAALLFAGLSAAAPTPDQDVADAAYAPYANNLVISQHKPVNSSDCNGSSLNQESWVITYRTLGQYFTNWWGQLSGCPQQLNYCLPWWEDVSYEDNIPDGYSPNVTRLSFAGNTFGRGLFTNTNGLFEQRVLNMYTDCNCKTTPLQLKEATYQTVSPAQSFCSFSVTGTPSKYTKRDENAEAVPQVEGAQAIENGHADEQAALMASDMTAAAKAVQEAKLQGNDAAAAGVLRTMQGSMEAMNVLVTDEKAQKTAENALAEAEKAQQA